MGRKKIYRRRFLIGLDDVQSEELITISKRLNYSYSDTLSAALDVYLLFLKGKLQE